MSLEIFTFEVENMVEIYVSKINVKDALEVLGCYMIMTSMNIFLIDGARITLLLVVQLKFKASLTTS